MLHPVLKNPWVQAGAALGGLALLGTVIYLLMPVLIPLLFAFLVAYVLAPAVAFSERRGLSRGFTVTAMAVAAVLLLISIPLLGIPLIIDQADAFRRAAVVDHDDSTPWARWAVYVEERLPLASFVELIGWGAPDTAEEAAQILRERTGLLIKERAVQLVRTSTNIVTSVGNFMIAIVLFIANFALFSFVAGYLLKDYNGIVQTAGELVPHRYRDKTFDIIARIDLQMRAFLRGQLTVALLLGSMYTIGLLICGTPFAILIGLLGVVASFIPYLGVVITLMPALLLTFLQYQLDWRIAGVLVTFGIAQFIESNILTPRIVGSQVGLSPVWVILAVVIFGHYLGFLGLLLAVPIAAGLKVLVLEGLALYRDSRLFKAGSASASGAGEGSASAEAPAEE